MCMSCFKVLKYNFVCISFKILYTIISSDWGWMFRFYWSFQDFCISGDAFSLIINKSWGSVCCLFVYPYVRFCIYVWSRGAIFLFCLELTEYVWSLFPLKLFIFCNKLWIMPKWDLRKIKFVVKWRRKNKCDLCANLHKICLNKPYFL